MHTPPSFPIQPGLLFSRLARCGLALAAGLLAVGALLALAGGTLASAAAPSIVVSTTIQDAIDAAPSGSTVFVPAGLYTESLTLSKTVSLVGALSSTTIIHALPGQRVLTVTGVSIHNSTIISGLTFAGGDVVDYGGGIIVQDNAQPRLQNLILTHNHAGFTGGGLYSDAGSPLLLVNVLVYSNTAGLYGAGAYALDALTLQGSLFLENACNGANCPGGGLSIGNSSPLALSDSSFFSNSATGNGGAVQALGPVTMQGGLFQGNTCTNCSGGGLFENDTVVITGTRFVDNIAVDSGGGLHSLGAVSVRDGVFQGNQCTAVDCLGGGLTAYVGGVLIDTQFISNTAHGPAGGGAVLVGAATVQGGQFRGNAALAGGFCGGGLFMSGNLGMTNTQFLENRSPLGLGGGMCTFQTGNAQLENVLFAGNSAAFGGAAVGLVSLGSAVILHSTIVSAGVASGSAIAVFDGSLNLADTLIASYTVGISRTAGTVTEDYNLFSGVTLTRTGAVSSGGHSLSGPARFQNPSAGDYHLGLGSAAINAGTNAGVATDADGDPRPIGAGFDIGYDEARLVRLELTKTDGQATVQSGGALTYTIQINNTGAFTATGVQVTDNLPASLIGGAWTCLASAGSSCSANGSGAISTTVTIAAGSFVQFTLHASVNPSANGDILNTVSANAPPDFLNSNAANNFASDTTNIVGGPEFKLHLPLVGR